LKSAYAEDRMIESLWNLIQTSAKYKNTTTLIITCDHGRGDIIKDHWKDHGEKIEEAGQLWLAVIGPDTQPLGELTSNEQVYQQQIAATIAQLLGFQFTANHPVAAPISSIFSK
jgi:bisphosphoglycerate-independent phosphoglycerate mutase (AlkP superfamily)